VVSGSSLVDEAAITGEPLPRNKYIGDLAFAGTLNGQGYLEVKVTKKAKDTTNIVSAISIKLLFLSLAIGGLSNLALAIFADVGVTVLVILNSLRLYHYKGIT